MSACTCPSRGESPHSIDCPVAYRTTRIEAAAPLPPGRVRPWYLCDANPCTCTKPGGMDRIARIEAAPPAPESFDALAAVRRLKSLADELDDVANDYEHAAPGTHDAGARNAHHAIAKRIRRAIRDA